MSSDDSIAAAPRVPLFKNTTIKRTYLYLLGLILLGHFLSVITVFHVDAFWEVATFTAKGESKPAFEVSSTAWALHFEGICSEQNFPAQDDRKRCSKNMKSAFDGVKEETSIAALSDPEVDIYDDFRLTRATVNEKSSLCKSHAVDCGLLLEHSKVAMWEAWFVIVGYFSTCLNTLIILMALCCTNKRAPNPRIGRCLTVTYGLGLIMASASMVVSLLLFTHSDGLATVEIVPERLMRVASAQFTVDYYEETAPIVVSETPLDPAGSGDATKDASTATAGDASAASFIQLYSRRHRLADDGADAEDSAGKPAASAKPDEPAGTNSESANSDGATADGTESDEQATEGAKAPADAKPASEAKPAEDGKPDAKAGAKAGEKAGAEAQGATPAQPAGAEGSAVDSESSAKKPAAEGKPASSAEPASEPESNAADQKTGAAESTTKPASASGGEPKTAPKDETSSNAETSQYLKVSKFGLGPFWDCLLLSVLVAKFFVCYASLWRYPGKHDSEDGQALGTDKEVDGSLFAVMEEEASVGVVV